MGDHFLVQAVGILLEVITTPLDRHPPESLTRVLMIVLVRCCFGPEALICMEENGSTCRIGSPVVGRGVC